MDGWPTLALTPDGWHVFTGENRKAVTVQPYIREMLARGPAGFETVEG